MMTDVVMVSFLSLLLARLARPADPGKHQRQLQLRNVVVVGVGLCQLVLCAVCFGRRGDSAA